MPPNDAARLRAVLDDPDADPPRLAYADWLDASPRPADRARAEFIRLQIELDSRHDNDLRWPRLVARERDLLVRYRAAWERPLRDRVRPSLATPGRWLRAALFGAGGRWGFRRGFVEHVLAPAPRFLAEDVRILDRAPVRRVVLSHASLCVGALAADPRLDRLLSLHLIGDMELDEDLSGMSATARAAGLAVLEFRLPRLWQDAEELFETLRTGADDRRGAFGAYPAWQQADAAGRRRLSDLARTGRLPRLAESAAHEGELLALNEWVYLGEGLADAGAWAVAKGHQDLEDEDGRCRRLVLLRPGHGAELRESPYCVGEVG